ncbi:MAG: hypothetical protein HHJ12_15740 [Glaciimonas sp.]|nr:hypothetical protein [Glaciimonas sp.]
MMYSHEHRIGDILRMLCVGMCVVVAQIAAAQDISPAETLLFQTNHLQNIHDPVRLTYAYKKVSNVEPGFDDEVYVDVNKINSDLSASVSMRFLSGTRKMQIPDVENSQGNPALLGFLERDIAEMRRLAGGSTNYFRKRIRLALANAAQVRNVIFTYKGKQVKGQEVSVQPYLNDPLHERFEKYVNKSYVFVISNQVSGGLYQIRTSSSGGNNGTMPQDKTLMEETLTLVKDGNSKI